MLKELTNSHLKITTAFFFALILNACGSGGGSSDSDINDVVFERDIYPDPDSLKDYCEAPRSSSDYDDKQGSAFIEKMWLRSWSEDVYLWYRELTDIDIDPLYSPLDYFETRKTDATTASGVAKDQFHFTRDTEEYNQQVSAGTSVGYGMSFELIRSTPPREAIITYVEPNSPAADAGITRGAKIVSIDGADLIDSNDVATLNNGLFPNDVNENHTFGIIDLNSTDSRTVSLTTESIEENPVLNTSYFTNSNTNERTGYLTFNTFGTQKAEEALVDAFTYLSDADVSDLVIDLRYNGGGFLAISSQLAYMISGSDNTRNKTYYQTQYNDKYTNTNPNTGREISPTPFYDTGLGWSTIPRDQDLPSLNLDRVFILTTESTCSASEAVMNGLDGIGVEVIQIGGKTCGKPYGFLGTDNCSTTYFTIMFQGVNDVGFGDYADGFYPASANTIGSTPLPGCEVADDFTHLLGDVNEGMLSAALQYKDFGTCPSQPVFLSKTIETNTDPSLDLLNDKRIQSKIMLDQALLIRQ